MRFIDWCGLHRIILAFFPLHLTYRLQPLNISLFGPLAQFYSEEADLWLQQCTGLRSFTKRDFFTIFWAAFIKAFLKKNILSAFKKTGLQPKEYDYVVKVVTRQPLEEDKYSSRLLVLLSFKVRVIWKLIKSVVDQSISKKTRKLVNTVEALTV